LRLARKLGKLLPVTVDFLEGGISAVGSRRVCWVERLEGLTATEAAMFREDQGEGLYLKMSTVKL